MGFRQRKKRKVLNSLDAKRKRTAVKDQATEAGSPKKKRTQRERLLGKKEYQTEHVGVGVIDEKHKHRHPSLRSKGRGRLGRRFKLGMVEKRGRKTSTPCTGNTRDQSSGSVGLP